jgi:hypothetical protein
VKQTRAMAILGLVLASSSALADPGSLDAAVGGAVGGGLGAFIGNEVGGQTGAIAGGAVGAAAGAAIATENDRDSYYRAPRAYRYPPPAPYYRAPSGYFCPPGQAKKGRC